MCTQYLHNIHPPTPFHCHLPPPLLLTPPPPRHRTCSPILWKKKEKKERNDIFFLNVPRCSHTLTNIIKDLESDWRWKWLSFITAVPGKLELKPLSPPSILHSSRVNVSISLSNFCLVWLLLSCFCCSFCN
jgi:hypothetical protein